MPRLTTPAERLIFPHPHLWLPMPRFSRRRCCCGGTCPGCLGNVPAEMQLDISGAADGICGVCEILNGTWVLSNFTLNGNGDCQWSCTINPALCNNYEPVDILRLTIAPTQFLVEGASIVVDYPVNLFVTSVEGPVDCMDVVDLSLSATDAWCVNGTCIVNSLT